MFQKLLQTLGLAPKTLDQAHTAFTEAKTTLDSVAALFTAAGLPLEQMLATGPDSLKAHLASLDKSADVTRLTTELGTATTNLTAANASLGSSRDMLAQCGTLFESIGFRMGPEFKEDIKTKFAAHVEKQTTVALAKIGHPPAHVPAVDVTKIDDVTPKKTAGDQAAAQALTDYEALIIAHNKSGDKADETAKAEFYAKNSALITRGMTLRRRK